MALDEELLDRLLACKPGLSEYVLYFLALADLGDFDGDSEVIHGAFFKLKEQLPGVSYFAAMHFMKCERYPYSQELEGAFWLLKLTGALEWYIYTNRVDYRLTRGTRQSVLADEDWIKRLQLDPKDTETIVALLKRELAVPTRRAH